MPGHWGGGCPQGPVPPDGRSRGRWRAGCRRCCWSITTTWWWSARSGHGAVAGSCCFEGRRARSGPGYPPGHRGSCGPDRTRCWGKCSRYSVEGKAERGPGRTAPTVTPAHHNLDKRTTEEGEMKNNNWIQPEASVIKHLESNTHYSQFTRTTIGTLQCRQITPLTKSHTRPGRFTKHLPLSLHELLNLN